MYTVDSPAFRGRDKQLLHNREVKLSGRRAKHVCRPVRIRRSRGAGRSCSAACFATSPAPPPSRPGWHGSGDRDRDRSRLRLANLRETRMTYQHLIVETRGRVGLIRLNRPDALNALNSALMTELAAAVAAF